MPAKGHGELEYGRHPQHRDRGRGLGTRKTTNSRHSHGLSDPANDAKGSGADPPPEEGDVSLGSHRRRRLHALFDPSL